MGAISKATSPEYVTSYTNAGIPMSKLKFKVEGGKRAKASGAKFETKVREDLESKKWIVAKWTNNVDIEVKDNQTFGKLVKCKPKFNPFTKSLMMNSAGFPDFISFKKIGEESYDVTGVEVKSSGTLSKIEKQKCHWLLENKIFSRILIAKKSKERGKVDYTDFKDRYKKDLIAEQ